MSIKTIEVEREDWTKRRADFAQTVLVPKRKALRLTQTEMAVRIGVHQSTISWIEQGRRPKDLVMALAVADGYELDPWQVDEWLYLFSGVQPADSSASLTEDSVVDRRTFLKAVTIIPVLGAVERDAHTVASFSSPDPLLEIYTDYAHTIGRIHLEGNPRGAVNSADSVVRLLDKLLDDPRFFSDRPTFLEILAQVVNYQGWAYSELAAVQEVWAQRTGFADKLRYLGGKHDYAPLLGLADEFLGDSYYVARRYRQAPAHLEAALQRVENIKHKFTTLTLLAKVWALLNRPQKFEEVRLEITRLIDEGQTTNLEWLSFTYGSLARAQARLRLEKEAYHSLEQSKLCIVQLKARSMEAPLREVQVVRDEVEVIRRLDPTGHPHYLRHRAMHALEIARQCHSQRLVDQLQQRLAEIEG